MRATQKTHKRKREKKEGCGNAQGGTNLRGKPFSGRAQLAFFLKKKTCFTTEAKRSAAGGLKMRGQAGWNTSKSAGKAARVGREKLLEAERRTKVRRGKMRRVKRVTAKAAAVRRNGADPRLSRRLLVYLRDEGGVFPLSPCLRSRLTVSLSTQKHTG